MGFFFMVFSTVFTMFFFVNSTMGKIAIAKMCLDEILYPDEQTSKFTMSPVRGGLFRGWNSDGGDDDGEIGNFDLYNIRSPGSV